MKTGCLLDATSNQTGMTFPFIERQSSFWLVLLPALLAVSVALPFAGAPFWRDEIFSVESVESFAELRHLFFNVENNMALYHALLAVWTHLFGASAYTVRSLSLLGAVLCFPVLYLLMREFTSKTASFFSCLLLSIHPMFLFYAIEARSYIFLVLSALVTSLLFFRWFYTPDFRRQIWFAIASAAGVYVHYFGVFVPFVCGVFLLLRKPEKRELRSFFLGGMLQMVLISPLILTQIGRTGQINWLAEPSVEKLLKGIIQLTGENTAGTLVFLGLLTLALIPAFSALDARKKDVTLFFLALLTLPMAITIVVSFTLQPVFTQKYLLFVLPAVVALLALTLFCGCLNRPSIYFLLLFFFINWMYLNVQRLPNKGSGFQHATAFVMKNLGEKDTVLCYPPHLLYYVDFFTTDKKGRRYANYPWQTQLPVWQEGRLEADLAEIRTYANSYSTVFLIIKETGSVTIEANGLSFESMRDTLVARFPKAESHVFYQKKNEPVRVFVLRDGID